MTLPIRLTSAAERDLALAELWYLEEAPHMLNAFENQVDRVVELLQEHPEMYPVVRGDTRRGGLEQFPFSIFYRVLPGWIEVVAVMHQSRHPRRWVRRL